MPRVQINKAELTAAELVRVPCIPSGSTLLDLILGGGWARGRVANIVGDKSAGKTLLAIEACANFALQFDAEHIRYAEAEAAFDLPYARSIGMPDGVQMTEEVRTVEQLEKDMTAWLKGRKDPSLYILDSLDALSDDAEMDREIGEATYGTGKAKMMSELFRRQTGNLRDANCTLIVISQIRDKIGVTFGETKTRSGGRALDFYASQIVWLSEIKKIDRTVTGVKRIVGVDVLARNKKNKIGKPFRQAEFSILFNYGVDDELSMIEWLKKNKGVALKQDGDARAPESYKALIDAAREQRDRSLLKLLHADLKKGVVTRWNEIETALEPTMAKY